MKAETCPLEPFARELKQALDAVERGDVRAARAILDDIGKQTDIRALFGRVPKAQECSR